jgi:hypothetical protein
MDGLVAVNVLADCDTLLTLLSRFERAFASVSVLATDPNYIFFLSKTCIPVLDADIETGTEDLDSESDAHTDEAQNAGTVSVGGVISRTSLLMWAERLGIASATMDALDLVTRTDEYLADKVVLGLMNASTFRELLMDERVGIV